MFAGEPGDLAFAARRRRLGDDGQGFERKVTRFQELGRDRRGLSSSSETIASARRRECLAATRYDATRSSR